ncbi:MAG: hypothetical protein ACE145_20660 [Terriglobia bacterium]
MKRSAILSIVALGLLAAAIVVEAVPPAPAPQMLEFNTMFPVAGPYVGTTNPIRGISGGGVPWVISEGRGELRSDGKLEIKVRGLVFASNGSNPVPNFRGVVSCQSIDGSGNPSVVNVSTGDFPASGTGDAVIEDTVELPHPCVAPIVFVTSSTLRWFAVTGH